jgi:hypothetical protein
MADEGELMLRIRYRRQSREPGYFRAQLWPIGEAGRTAMPP